MQPQPRLGRQFRTVISSIVLFCLFGAFLFLRHGYYPPTRIHPPGGYQPYGRLPDLAPILEPKSGSVDLLNSTTTTPVTAQTQSGERKAGATNPHPFKWLILEKDICNRRKDLFILIVVHSAPANLKHRLHIRNTYGSRHYYEKVKTVVVFALGKPTNAPMQQRIEHESEQFHDIIQEDFVDSYRNLTYKAIMWLRWSSTYCSNAHFVLKADDDIFVNIFNIASHLSFLQHQGEAKNGTILCLQWTRMKVQRNKTSKWYVSVEDYDKDYFSTYCSGSAYIFTIDLIKPMYEASFKIKFFWVDDFYITGLLPNATGVHFQYKNIGSLYVLKPTEMRTRLVDGYAIFGHIGSLAMRRHLWNDILENRGLIGRKT